MWLAKTPVKLPLFGLVKLPLLASAYTLLRGFPPPTPAKTFSVPPLSTPEPGSLHLEDSPFSMIYLPKDRFVLVERSHFPRVSHCSRPSPIPCNVAGVSRGRIPITVHSTCLHGCHPSVSNSNICGLAVLIRLSTR